MQYEAIHTLYDGNLPEDIAIHEDKYIPDGEIVIAGEKEKIKVFPNFLIFLNCFKIIKKKTSWKDFDPWRILSKRAEIEAGFKNDWTECDGI